MSPHVIDYNERESPRPSLCREIIITQKAESKKWNTACIAGQISDNQDKDDSFLILQTRQNECWKMATHNIIKHEQQTVTFVTERLEYMEVLGRYVQLKVI